MKVLKDGKMPLRTKANLIIFSMAGGVGQPSQIKMTLEAADLVLMKDAKNITGIICENFRSCKENKNKITHA